jgi:ferredoxin
MRITVDPWACQSHMQCIAVAPSVIRYDEEHSYAVGLDGDIPAELEEVARRAVLVCPERAITIEE